MSEDFETGLRDLVKTLNLIANKANERKRSHRSPKPNAIYVGVVSVAEEDAATK
jgi:hypothetical protein